MNRLKVSKFSKASIAKIEFHHSQKKRKDSLETRAILLIFSIEREIYGVAVQSIHQNSEKWQLLLGTAL